MMVNALLFSLVFIWSTAAAQALGVELNELRVDTRAKRNKQCRKLDGRCVRRRKDCPAHLPEETLPGKPFCRNKWHRCCYPENDAAKHLDDLATHELWLHILHQFDRPYEDRFTYRGEENYVYHLDNEKHNPDKRSTPIIIPALDDFTRNKQRFKKLLNYPKGENVLPSFFEPEVKEAAKELYGLYLEHPSAHGILKVAVNSKDYVNEYIHIHTLIHALAFDNDVDGYGIPPLYEVFPSLFTSDFSTNAIDTGDDCHEMEYPEDNLTGDEWKISYYREDASFNNFHGNWHKYNTLSDIQLTHGELFFYFHNQLVARYDMERLSNDMNRVIAIDNWTIPIPQNYTPPVLTKTLARCADMPSQILHQKLQAYRNNLQNDVLSKKSLIRKSGTPALNVSLVNDDGIKYLACVFERTACGDFEPDLNRYYKGGIHNYGHVYMSEIGCPSDPINRVGGVVGHPVTAVRDPLFFRWHKFVDGVFQSQKKELPSYNLSQLVMEGVTVMSVGVFSIGKEGELYTFKDINKLTLPGIESTSTCTNYPKLNHHPFKYNIIIDNSVKGGQELEVNVRIYLAPIYLSSNSTTPIHYEDQRTLWALMDRFDHKLKSGSNTIERNSSNSSILSLPDKSLQELRHIYKNEESYNNFVATTSKCQCGLPEHLLIPKGKPGGMTYQLLVYITPYNSGIQNTDCNHPECSDLCSKDYTRCLHSDKEPMGFPFDRPLKKLNGQDITTIHQFTSMLNNALLHDIKIIYNEN